MNPDWLESPNQFEQIREEWLDLVAHSTGASTIFHHPDWILACWKYPANRLCMAVLRDPSTADLMAGFCFHMERDFGSAVLWPIPLLGMTPHISNAFPAGMIYAIRPQAEALLDLDGLLQGAFSRLKCPAGFFSGLGDESDPLSKALVEVSKTARWRLRWGESSTDAWVDIAEGLDAYLSRRSGKFRQNQRRARRQLEEMGKIDYLDAAREEWTWNQIAASIEEAFERSWQVDSEESPLHSSRRAATLESCHHLFDKGLFHALFFRLDGLPIAFEFGISDEAVYYPLVRGHDKQFARQSPGNLLAEESIVDFHRQGKQSIFLGAIHLSETTRYKTHWMNRETANRNALLLKNGSLYERVDRLYHRSTLFQKVWWKFRIGERLRKRYRESV